MDKLLTSYLPRAGLFSMIAGAGLFGWFLAPFTTLAYISAGLALTIAGFIIKDRWFS